MSDGIRFLFRLSCKDAKNLDQQEIQKLRESVEFEVFLVLI